MTKLLNWILEPAAAIFLSVYVVYGFLQGRPLFSVRKTNTKFIIVAVISFVALLFSPVLMMIGSHFFSSSVAFQNRTIPLPLGWVPETSNSPFIGPALQKRDLSLLRLPITLFGKLPHSAIFFSKVRYRRSTTDQYLYWKTAAADELGAHGMKVTDFRAIESGDRESFCMNFGTPELDADDWQCLMFRGEFEASYMGPSSQSPEFFYILSRLK